MKAINTDNMTTTEKYEIIEGGKLIAEFMGYKYFPHPEKYPGWRMDSFIHPKVMNYGPVGERRYLCRKHHELRFYNEWNWLMPVVEKIEAMGYVTELVVNDGLYFSIYQPEEDSLSGIGPLVASQSYPDKIRSIFITVRDFIKWYNAKHPKP